MEWRSWDLNWHSGTGCPHTLLAEELSATTCGGPLSVHAFRTSMRGKVSGQQSRADTSLLDELPAEAVLLHGAHSSMWPLQQSFLLNFSLNSTTNLLPARTQNSGHGPILGFASSWRGLSVLPHQGKKHPLPEQGGRQGCCHLSPTNRTPEGWPSSFFQTQEGGSLSPAEFSLS